MSTKNNVHKLDAAAELAAETAKQEAAKRIADMTAQAEANLPVYLDDAAKLGIAKARGANSLTALCYRYQNGVRSGEILRGHNVKLYNAYADAHDAHLSDAEMQDSGLKAIAEESRVSARSNLLTFSDAFVLAQGSELYARILKIRGDMEKDEIVDGSPLSHFVRLNRRIAEKGEKTAHSITPDKLVIEDSEIKLWLTKESAVKTEKTPEMRLEAVIATLVKLNKDSAYEGELSKVLQLSRLALANLVTRNVTAESAPQHAEIVSGDEVRKAA
jgi:hypothetical protein